MIRLTYCSMFCSLFGESDVSTLISHWPPCLLCSIPRISSLFLLFLSPELGVCPRHRSLQSFIPTINSHFLSQTELILVAYSREHNAFIGQHLLPWIYLSRIMLLFALLHLKPLLWNLDSLIYLPYDLDSVVYVDFLQLQHISSSASSTLEHQVMSLHFYRIHFRLM